VKHAVTRIKGHAGRRKVKVNIKSWDIMVAKFKGNSVPKDYQLNLFRQLQNLRQKNMTVKEYTKEFYRLNIRVGHIRKILRRLLDT
jgi:hypothetical protein